jgi:hypothetical protein
VSSLQNPDRHTGKENTPLPVAHEARQQRLGITNVIFQVLNCLLVLANFLRENVARCDDANELTALHNRQVADPPLSENAPTFFQRCLGWARENFLCHDLSHRCTRGIESRSHDTYQHITLRENANEFVVFHDDLRPNAPLVHHLRGGFHTR